MCVCVCVSTHQASTQDGLIGLECGESESCDEETARPSPEQMQCAHLQLLGDAVRQAAQPAGHALGATQPAGHTVQAAQAAGHAGPQQTEQVSSGGGTRSSPLSARQLTLHLLEHVNKVRNVCACVCVCVCVRVCVCTRLGSPYPCIPYPRKHLQDARRGLQCVCVCVCVCSTRSLSVVPQRS